MKINHYSRGILLSVFVVGIFNSSHAAQTITAMVTTEVRGTSSTATVAGAGTTAFPTATNFTLNYAGGVRTLQQYSAGTQNFVPINYSGSINVDLRRSGITSNNNVIWQKISSTTGNTYNLAGSAVSSQAVAFNGTNFNVGTDNLFTNTGNTSGNINNIERVDVVFSNGLVASNDLNFAVWERGATGGHDGFKIAAITSIDITGKPTSYGAILAVTTGSWGTTSLNTGLGGTSFDTLVNRNAINGSGLGATNPSAALTGQAIGGITIPSTGTGSLALNLGSAFFGYSVFASDTTAISSADLLDWTNPIFFPATTLEASGGIDMLSYAGVFSQVPEPSAMVLGSLGLLYLLRRNRRPD
jgi:hypothetical protein